MLHTTTNDDINLFGWRPLNLPPQVPNMNMHVQNVELLQPTMFLAVTEATVHYKALPGYVN